MIFISGTFQDSGAKPAASPRTRKSPAKKAKTTVTAEVDDNLPAEPVGVQHAVPTPVNNFQSENHQEDAPEMTQTHSEQAWQGESELPQEQGYAAYQDQQGTIGYADDEGYYEGEGYVAADESTGQSNNQILLTLSYSLMNQVKQVARMEGVFPEDILIELIAEGVTRRAFEDAQRPAPSHLMTRTGYVAPDANGNVQQPQLSHHSMQGHQRGNHQGHNNRRYNQNGNQNGNRGNHFQGRNRQNQFKNKQRNGK
ncbi:MAG: hypothetical protein RL189_3150 [Pseudomonadota bacterium]